MNNDLNIPIFSPLGAANESTNVINHVNFNLLPVFSRKGPPGASIFSFQQPCVHWFGEDYPNSDLYERPVDMDLLAKVHAAQFPNLTQASIKSSRIEFRDR